MLDLSGKTALVTGAGTRVGRAIALGLARAGMNVGVHYHASSSGAQQTADDIRRLGRRAEVFQADLSDRTQARALIDAALAAFSTLHVLVPSAANFERIPYPDLDDAAWDRALDLNLTAPFTLVHHASSALRQERGSVVFITCASATTPFRNYLPYVVSKGALRQLMRTLALELAPEVRVSAVAPGTVLPPATMPQSAQDHLARAVPLGRIGEATDVAEAVTYLAAAPFVTGHELLVDGGRGVARLERFG